MGRILTEGDYRSYIDAFNRGDYDGFGDYYQENVVLTIVGKRELRGRQAIVDFYRTVRAQTRRTIHVRRVIVGENQLAAELESEFLALQDVPDFLAGPMLKGGRILVTTFVFCELQDGRFSRIRSAEYQKVAIPP